MTERVRAALVGAGGFAGGAVVPRLASYANLEYVAVCDPDQEAARRAAERIGARVVTADYAQIVSRGDVQMVDLQTPNFLHADQALAALRAGKHVLVQKPMATSLDEAKRMIRAARETGRRLGVFMDDLNDPLLWDMKAALQAGFVGRPVGFRIRYAHGGGLHMKGASWRTSRKKTGGGSFILLTVHFVNVLAWLLETRVARVAGFAKTLMAPMEGDDSAVGALELENGLVGSAESSYLVVHSHSIPQSLVDVYGTEGSLSYRRAEPELVLYSKTGTFRGETGIYDAPGAAKVFTTSSDAGRHPSVHERFAAAVLGRSEPLVTAEAGLHDLAVCLALAESSRTGLAVDLRSFIGDVA